LNGGVAIPNFIDTWSDYYSKDSTVGFPAQGLIRIMLGEYPTLPKIAKTGKSLDLGCGSGRNTKFLNQIGFESWGIEISTEIVSILSKKVPECNFELGTSAKLPFEKDFFDCIVAWNSIYYLEENNIPEQLLRNFRECHRVIKKSLNSTFIFTIPCPTSFIFKNSEVTQKLNGIQVRKITSDPFNLRNGDYLSTFESKSSLKNSLERIGFKNVVIAEELGDWFGYQYDWWVVVCKV
jgi:SAM-dependent methyltransferase